MTSTSPSVISTDICIIGGGSGGLSVAAGAVQMGAEVTLIEKAAMGGDCLNTGCIPSKALLAAAKAAYTANGQPAMGITASSPPQIDFAAVKDHVDEVIAGIAPHDSVTRFEGLGVRVLTGTARFSGPAEVIAETENGTVKITARYIVIATGSQPWIPPITGLSDTPFYTNETIFNLRDAPEHLIIIGGGPIGIEMAQAHIRLGCRVSVIEPFALMGRDDPDLSGALIEMLEAEGIGFYRGAQIETVAHAGSSVHVTLETGQTLAGSHLLVAVGRRANVAGLALETARITASDRGITTDERLRTSNRRVFAIGDVAGRHQFTHMAGYHAGIVIRNMLFRLPAKLDNRAVPWVTYTDPELAHTGISKADAETQYGAAALTITDWPLSENDRARAERKTGGMVRVITDKRGRILGASILAPHAGEMIHSWTLAINAGLKIGVMANTIAPYPSWSEASKRAAGAWFTETLFAERTKKLVRFLLMFQKRG